MPEEKSSTYHYYDYILIIISYMAMLGPEVTHMCLNHQYFQPELIGNIKQ